MNFFNDQQKKIYGILRDFVVKKPHFTIYELFMECTRKSNLDDEEITKSIEKFIKKKVIILGSRLTKDEILENKTRSEIFDLISTKPGLHFNYIINQINIGVHAGYWHIDILKKFDYIKERKYSIYNVYFEKSFPEDKELIVFLLRNENVRKIYSCLNIMPMNTNKISKILDLHYTTVQYHLERLEKNDFIFKEDHDYNLKLEYIDFLEKYYDLTLSDEYINKIKKLIEIKRDSSINMSENIPVK